MQVLGNYHEALGAIITRNEVTLTNVSADGVMRLLYARMPCADQALRAVEMAIDIQDAVQRLILERCLRGHSVGFGSASIVLPTRAPSPTAIAADLQSISSSPSRTGQIITLGPIARPAFPAIRLE